MPTVVGVRFKAAGKVYHFDPGGLDLHRLDRVIVDTAGGLSIGRVVTEPSNKPASDLPSPLRRVLRRANAADFERERQGRARADAVLDACRRHVRRLGLAMRPVEADATLDGGRVTITFTAEERVDFRQLVRDLTAECQCRIDLRQVGARDEAKALDGIGPCGQRLCCSRWLTEFQPISIKMAKIQNLALNPGKLAGACGRLKCCLRYEVENYAEAQRELPTLGSRVFTAEGEGRVVGLNLLERRVQVLFDDPAPRWLPADEVFRHNGCQDGMCETCRSAAGEAASEEPAPGGSAVVRSATHPSGDAGRVRRPPQRGAAPSPHAPGTRPGRRGRGPRNPGAGRGADG
jgi:cell fate regulator YaaT (PSP1 superfamily)